MTDLQGKLEKLNNAVRVLRDAQGKKQLVDKILEVVGNVFGRETAAVLLVEPDGEHLKIEAARGYDNEIVSIYRPKIGEGIAGAVAENGKPRLIEDVTKERDYVRGVRDAVSEMVVPLVVDEKVVGVLDIESQKAPFNEDDMALLTAFAEHAALALRHDNALAEARERSRRITLLNKASRAVNAIHDPEQLLDRILELAHEALGFDSTAILTPKGAKQNLIVKKALGRIGVEGITIPLGKGVTNSVFKTGEAALIDDITKSENYVPGGMEGARSEMAAPLNLNGDIIGVLDAESTRVGAFNDLDLEVFCSFAAQVATALANAEKMRMLDEKGKRLELLNKVARALNSFHDTEALLEFILKSADEALGFNSVAILVVDKTGKNLVVRKALRRDNVEGIKIPVDQGIVGTVYSSRTSEIVNDVTADPRYISGGTTGVRSEMAAPLNLNGSVIGVLDAEAEGSCAYTDSDLEVFTSFAAQVATALRSAQLFDDLEDRARRLEHITGAGHALNTILSADDLIDEILKAADKALGLGRVALLMLDSDNRELVVHAARGYGDVIGKKIPMGQGVTGEAALKGEPQLVRDVKSNGRYLKGIEGGRSEMAVPLRVFGEIIGILDCESPEEEAFDERDMELFGAFADQAAVAIHNAKLFADLEQANERLTTHVAEVSRLNKELEAYAAQIGEANLALEAQIRQLTTLHEAGQTITASLNLDDTLGAILRMTGEIVKSSAGAIRLLDEETKELKLKAKAGIVHDGSGPYFKYDLPLKIGHKTIGVFELIHKATQEMDEGDKQMLETLASQAAIAIENARLFEDTQRIYYETLKSLAKALEARDDYTRGHSERVADFSLAIAKELGLPEDQCNIIYNSALLHDIGKIGVRDEVLLKPRQLTDAEMEIIRKHPTYSNAILGPLKFLGEVSELVKYHHERWDGSGYPMGLKGEDIPLASRIIGVADAYDAMTSTRPYRKAMSHKEAIDEIAKQNDVQFDPQIVGVFLKIIDEIRVR